MAPYIVPLAIFAGIMIVAYLAGNYVTKTLRMPETGWKVSLIVAVIGLAVWILVTNWPPKQGIDLKGGVILIYEVDDELTRQTARRRQTAQGDQPAAADEELGKVDMPGLVQALSRRINPGGVQEIVVRPYGDKQVEIIIPDVSGPGGRRDQEADHHGRLSQVSDRGQSPRPQRHLGVGRRAGSGGTVRGQGREGTRRRAMGQAEPQSASQAGRVAVSRRSAPGQIADGARSQGSPDGRRPEFQLAGKPPGVRAQGLSGGLSGRLLRHDGHRCPSDGRSDRQQLAGHDVGPLFACWAS